MQKSEDGSSRSITSQATFHNVLYRRDPPASGRDEMECVRLKDSERQSLHATHNERITEPMGRDRNRSNACIKTIGILALFFISAVITIALHLHQQSEWTKGLKAQAQRISELAESLENSTKKIQELERRTAYLEIKANDSLKLSQTSTERATNHIQQRQNISEVLQKWVDEYSQLRKIVMKTVNQTTHLENRSQEWISNSLKYFKLQTLIKRSDENIQSLQNQTEALQIKAMQCSRLPARLTKAENAIAKVENMSARWDSQHAKNSELSKVLDMSKNRIRRLESRSKEWDAHEAMYFGMASALNETKKNIRNVIYETEALRIKINDTAYLPAKLVQIEDELAKLNIGSKALQLEAERCSNESSKLLEVENHIQELEVRSEMWDSHDAQYLKLANLLNTTSTEAERLRNDSEEWGTMYRSISASVHDSITKIHNLENQTEALQIWADERPLIYKRLKKLENEIMLLYNRSDEWNSDSVKYFELQTLVKTSDENIQSLQNQTDALQLKAERCSNVFSKLLEVENHIHELEVRSDTWGTMYRSISANVQDSITKIQNLENQTEALQIRVDERPLVSKRLKKMENEIMLLYNISDARQQNLSQSIIDSSAIIAEMNQTMRQLLNESGYCPIKYSGKCFWVARRLDPLITFQEGRDICASLGGTPANIYSEKHHYMIMEYLRALSTNHNDIYAWIGMTYSFQTYTTYLSDGRRAPFVKWYPGNPRAQACCNMALRPRANWLHEKQDMYTSSSTSRKKAVICETRML